MGNFYTNFTVQGPTPQAVAAALAGRSAAVTPDSEGSVVIFDEESDSQDLQVIAELGARLSVALGRPVLAVGNHDDSILFYQLFERGARTDEYCSAPGYFSGEDSAPEGGDARKLCAAFGAPDPAVVEAVLHPASGELPTFALEQHEALVQALGLSGYAVGGGYSYVAHGELPHGLSGEDLLRVE